MARGHEGGAHRVRGVDIHPLADEAFEGGEVALPRRLEQCHLGHTALSRRGMLSPLLVLYFAKSNAVSPLCGEMGRDEGCRAKCEAAQ